MKTNLAADRLLLISDGQRDLLSRLKMALSAGARIVQIREPKLTDQSISELVLKLKDHCPTVRIFINDRVRVAEQLDVGVHLPERSYRIPGTYHVPLSCAVHSVEAARDALEQGAELILFGHVFSTPSKAGLPPRGLQALADVCAYVADHNERCKVFGLGGIGHENARDVRTAGAHGVAVMRSVLSSDDPMAAVHALLDALA